MKVVHPWLFIVVPCRSAVAFPLSHGSTVAVTASEAYVPILVISISLFLFIVVFLVVKLAYMKHRRIGTIHAPSTIRKRTSRHGLVVGCLGSPAWETHLTSKLDGTWRRQRRRRSSFANQLHILSMASTRSKSRNSTSGSRFTRTTALASYSSHTERVVLPSSTRSSRITQYDDGSASRALASSQRKISTNRHSRYGDFGEFYNARLPGGLPSATRRASPSSIRLVDGPSHSNQVEYSFLSALPPDAMVASPLMGTRDSFQLSRCSLKSNRKPAPPLPSLPAMLPFHMPTLAVDPCSQRNREYLPRFYFSPLASIAKVFHSQQQAIEERSPGSPAPDSAASGTECLESTSSSRTLVAGSPMSPWVAQEIPTPHPIRRTYTTFRHKRSRSYKGLAIEGSLPRTPLVNVAPAMPLEDERRGAVEPTQTSVLRTPGSSRKGSIASNKPLKSCLRQPSGVPVALASIRTPLTEDDIGMLGLDRFRWNDDIKEHKLRCSHMKKDSVVLVPLLE